MAKLTLEDVPELPGYVSVAVAASKYGVHKGTIYYMIYTQQKFRHVYKINTSTNVEEPRPVILLLEDEVRKVFEDKEREANKPAKLVQRVREWNRRVKAWGVEIGWDESPIHPSGPPPVALVATFLQEHPDDPHPE